MIVFKRNGSATTSECFVVVWNLYYGQEATVRTESGETECFPGGKGVRVGCSLSPCRLNLYAEHIIRKGALDLDEGR